MLSLFQRATQAESEVHSLKEQLENFKVQSSKENLNNNNTNTNNKNNEINSSVNSTAKEDDETSTGENHNIVESSEAAATLDEKDPRSPLGDRQASKDQFDQVSPFKCRETWSLNGEKRKFLRVYEAERNIS